MKVNGGLTVSTHVPDRIQSFGPAWSRRKAQARIMSVEGIFANLMCSQRHGAKWSSTKAGHCFVSGVGVLFIGTNRHANAHLLGYRHLGVGSGRT